MTYAGREAIVETRNVAADSQIPLITIAAIVPGPRTGMTLVTGKVVAALEARSRVRVIDFGKGFERETRLFRMLKPFRYIRAALFLWMERPRDDRVLYVAANSRWGLFYDLVLLAAARRRGFFCVVHHHVYSYIDQRSLLMAAIVRVIGSRGTHVLLCEDMQRSFARQYPGKANYLLSPPSMVAMSAKPRRAWSSGRLVLGHLSNLTIAKGLRLAIETFEALLASGVDVALDLAGPCGSTVEQSLVDDAVARNADRVTYRGPIYGASKQHFYENIDIFLFPTLYRNESYGIVLCEALVAGAPAIAYGLGCIPCVIGPAGVVISPSENFVSVATKVIEHWIRTPVEFARMAEAASRQGQALMSDGEASLERLVAHVLEAAC
jgi:glycosyltransferase involved in cell wall biosynthesis